MGLLDRILEAIFPRQFGEGAIVEPEEEKIEEERTGAPISRDVIYQRKIIKPRASERRGGKAVKLFAVTFEDNFTDRSLQLAEEILRYAKTHDVWLEPDIDILIGGYDDQLEFTNPPFTWDTIEVGTE